MTKLPFSFLEQHNNIVDIPIFIWRKISSNKILNLAFSYQKEEKKMHYTVWALFLFYFLIFEKHCSGTLSETMRTDTFVHFPLNSRPLETRKIYKLEKPIPKFWKFVCLFINYTI